MKRALFIGRFQPFHIAHLKDVNEILKSYDEVLIGIGSSQEKNTFENPFSYNERKKMISKVLKGNKINNFRIYPVPDLYDDAKWIDCIKKNIPKFDIAFSGNEWTLRCFRKHNFKVKKIKLIKEISSTKIREMIVKNGNWEILVPQEIVKSIKNIKGVERIKRIYSKL